MAFFSAVIKSSVLDMRTNVNIVLPDNILEYDKKYKVVYLLHGLSDNCYSWYQNSQLSILSNDYNVAFVMPEVQRSFYINMEYGLNYFDYVSKELPQICQKLFNISDKREDNFVMGLSMGGYGALKCALTYPEKFCGCGAFSSACDLKGLLKYTKQEMFYKESIATLGNDLIRLKENNIFNIIKKCDKNEIKPELFVTCGTEDFIYNMSVKLKRALEKTTIPFTYKEWQGAHEWYFWNKSLHLACKHFFEKASLQNYCNIV